MEGEKREESKEDKGFYAGICQDKHVIYLKILFDKKQAHKQLRPIMGRSSTNPGNIRDCSEKMLNF